jgi:aryl-alcohol dehydrogenase-like predicted oxidoreductase
MRYKLLGRSGLRVSEIALGTMTFGEDWGWGASKTESYQIFEAFSEAGGNFIDTSVNYTDGTSEKFVGEFIHPERDRYVVATKFSLRADTVDPNDPNAGGNQRKNMRRAVETSLRSLNTDYIDLYYLHMWEYMTPVEEVMRGLDDLVSSGKVLYIGLSDSPAWVASKANMLAELRGWSRFVALQVPYSLVDRAVERDLLPMARAEDMAVLAWGILEGGVLTGKYSNAQGATRYERVSERAIKHGEAVVELAQQIGHTPAQIAVNWIRQRPWGGAPIIPILGARSLDQFHDLLGAMDFELTPEQIANLEQVAPFEIDFPEAFLKSDNVRRLIFGKTFELTDNHRALD